MSLTQEAKARTLRALRIVLVIVLVGLMALDPYSYGSVGGDRHLFAFHGWQVIATLALLILLASAAVQRSRGVAARLFAVELGLFLVTNLVYVLRDGIQTRSVVGNQSYYLPGMLVLAGIVIRLVLTLIEAMGSKLSSAKSRR